MHFLTPLLPLLLSIALPATSTALPPRIASTALPPRSANAVYNDILGIHYAVLNLTSAVTAYQGGIQQASPVFSASLAVHAVNRRGYADAVSSTPFSAADSQRIADAVTSTVAISIPASVKVLEAKKPLFDAAEISSLVLSTIELLKYDHESFSAATAAKLTAALVEATAGAGIVEAALVEAVAYYSL